MPHSATHLYVHFVWATWNRAPLITPALEPSLYACITAECQQLNCQPLAIGGTEDHVHALVRLRSTTPVAALAKAVKGASSHPVTHLLAPGEPFKWQGTYGAFTVSPNHVDRVRAYILGQKQHHVDATVHLAWEHCMTEADP